MQNYVEPKIHTRKNSLNKRWFISYYFKHPDTHKMQRFVVWASTKHKTLEYKLRSIVDLQGFYAAKLKSGWSPFESNQTKYITLVESFEFILKVKANSLRKKTIASYKQIFGIFKAWLLANHISSITLERFNYKQAQQYCDFLKIEKAVNNRTHNNHLLTLRFFYNQLIKREYTLTNPFKKIERLEIQAPEIRPIKKKDLQLLSESIQQKDKNLWLACQFIFYCFIRPTEMVMLKRKHVFLEANEILIPAYISKNKIQQVVTIPESFKVYLQLIDFEKIHEENFIFSKNLEPGTEKISSRLIPERFKKHCKKLSLDYQFYDLKHTGAGMAIDNGVNIEDLRNQLRHADLTTTTIYLKKFRNIASHDLRNKFPEISII